MARRSADEERMDLAALPAHGFLIACFYPAQPANNRISPMTQPRKAERVRTLMSAQVMYGAAPAIDCIVKNFSPAGVRLEISDRTPLPNEFELNIPHKGRIYHGRIAWRGEGIVGVEFLEKGAAAPDERIAHEDEGDRVDQLLQENAKLRAQVLQLRQRVAQLTGES